MIKCNRCGNITPAGPVCQTCGAPLSSKNDAGFSQRTGPQEQAELPAWLGSLRAGERSAPPTGDGSNFSTASFMDEESLPSWMRAERAEATDTSAAQLAAPEHLPAFPGQAPDGGTFPPNGLAAQSLIDEKYLPSWMKDGKQVPPSSPGSLSASSLLQQDNVPDWMKALPPQSGPAPVQGRAERMEQPERPMASPSSDLGHGFSASDLLDQQALPAWMKPQSERMTPSPQAEPFGQNGQGTPLPQSGFSASSLLDADALPQWMREEGRDSRSNIEPPQPAWPTQTPSSMNWPNTGAPSNQGWPMGQMPPASAQPLMPANSDQGGSVPASSFVDANALPEWLRNAGEQRPQVQQPMSSDLAGPQRQGSYAVPPRVDNVRVPSRPRGNEPGASESSEVAANVFASMLGVASTAPNYPGKAQEAHHQQPTNSQAGQMSQPAMPSGSFQGPRSVPNTPTSVGGAPQYPPSGMPANTLGTAGVPNSPATPGYGNGMPGNYAPQAGGYPAMGSPYYPGNAASSSQPGSSTEMNGDQKNGKKRGLFGAFLDWLSR